MLRSIQLRRVFATAVLVGGMAYAMLSPSVSAQSASTGLSTVQTLSHVRQVRTLSPEQASLSRPVRLKGVVTALSGWKNSFFLQDSTAGVSVDRLDTLPELQAGDEVVLNGTTAPGSFAPIVVSQSVRILHRTALPPARLYGPAELIGGTADSQWLAVHGKIRTATLETVWGRSILQLRLDIGSDVLVEVHVRNFTPGADSRLAGATVTIRGVCGTIFNDQRQFIGLRLFVSSLQDIRVEQLPPADPFDVPVRQLGNLFQFRDSMKVADQVKVRGVVSWSKPGEGFYLQEGTQAAFIDSHNSFKVEQGTRVEAVGYPIRTLGIPSLRATLVRAVPGKGVLAGVPHSAAEMITVRDGFISTPYAARLVTLEAKLLDVISGESAHSLVLQDGPHIFRAVLPASSSAPYVQKGSVLRVTGVCSLKLDETGEASTFGILMRGPGDLVVIKRPPWWNATHALQSLAVLCAVLLGVVVWALIARRRAELKALVLTDPLTSLYNRRGFELLAQKHTQIAQRRHADLMLFYFDVDRFKQINDTFGHRQGDLALQAVAAALQKVFRESDIVGRLGGDEFAVIAIDALTESQDTLLQRFRDELATINEGSDQRFQLKVSTGVVVCHYDEKDRTLTNLLERADTLMYEDKARRREEERDKSIAFTPSAQRL